LFVVIDVLPVLDDVLLVLYVVDDVLLVLDEVDDCYYPGVPFSNFGRLFIYLYPTVLLLSEDPIEEYILPPAFLKLFNPVNSMTFYI